MKKAAKVEYGIQITKPWSREMYVHNDEVADVVRAAVHQMWVAAWNECEREVTDMDEQGDLLIYMEWDVASDEMKRIQTAVTCYGFGFGYSVEDVSLRVEEEIESAPYYRLKDIAEELEIKLEKGFVGFS
jgi:hypothetical protein